MSFNIRIPHVVANFVPKRSGTASLTNKSKAGGLGIDTADGNRLKYNRGGTVATLKANSEAAVASGGATRVLTAANSGSVNLFDAATGIAYTLPVPVAGMEFDFIVTVLQTAGANVVATDSAATFLLGTVLMFSGEAVTPSATLGPFQFAGNGTTHVKTTTNGTTTGGGIGSWMRYKAISATQWYVTGVIKSPSGNLATPFSV